MRRPIWRNPTHHLWWFLTTASSQQSCRTAQVLLPGMWLLLFTMYFATHCLVIWIKSTLSQAKSWRKCIHLNMELTEVRRQTDREFISLLHMVRLGRWDVISSIDWNWGKGVYLLELKLPTYYFLVLHWRLILLAFVWTLTELPHEFIWLYGTTRNWGLGFLMKEPIELILQLPEPFCQHGHCIPPHHHWSKIIKQLHWAEACYLMHSCKVNHVYDVTCWGFHPALGLPVVATAQDMWKPSGWLPLCTLLFSARILSI